MTYEATGDYGDLWMLAVIVASTVVGWALAAWVIERRDKKK